MDFKQHLREYAEKELELTGFMQSEFGAACLEFLEKCADVAGNDPEGMKRICKILPRLIDRRPLSPITETDFEAETHTEGDRSLEILRCTRYSYLYRMPDGKYYDDRAVAFRHADGAETDRMYIYQSGNSSKQEVELPYFPREEVRVLQQEYRDLPNEEVKVLQQEYRDLPNIDSEPDYEVE